MVWKVARKRERSIFSATTFGSENPLKQTARSVSPTGFSFSLAQQSRWNAVERPSSLLDAF
jgi:hypothetical protein